MTHHTKGDETRHTEKIEAARCETHAHRAKVPPVHRLYRTLDLLLTVLTADLIVDIGVLITGVILVLIEVGIWSPGEHGEPTPVVVVRTTRDEGIHN